MQCSQKSCLNERLSYGTVCRECHNRRHQEWVERNRDKVRSTNLKQNYGISLEEYEELLEEQGGLCAICQRPEVQIHYKTGVPKNLAVDHDHETGQIRGLLCGGCNNLLAAAKDDMALLQAAIEYLDEQFVR